MVEKYKNSYISYLFLIKLIGDIMIIKMTKTCGVHGHVVVSGSKNSSLAAISAALLTKEKVVLTNIPNLKDIEKMLNIITTIGVKATRKENTITLSAKKLKKKISTDLVKDIRGSYYLMGVLLARYGKVVTKFPGGCHLGGRPIDYHLDAFNKLGFSHSIEDGIITIKEVKRKPAIIELPKPSVGATINITLLATAIKGQTVIENASIEPEVQDVISMLKAMGAHILVDENRIIIEGKHKLRKVQHKIMNDRLEASSYLFLAGALPNSRLVIHNVNAEDMQTVIIVARSMGINVETGHNCLVVEGANKINKTNLIVGAYPFFPTDLQQILTVVLTRSEKESSIQDTIFPNRISHVVELNKMGANITVYNGSIYIRKSELKGKKVKAHDLRCAMALIIAGALADGVTYIENGEMLLRGYDNPIEKLKAIGLIVDTIGN